MRFSEAVRALALTLPLCLPALPVGAEASGPDYFQVTGVASDDVLNLRDGPSAASAKIGTIPHDADGLANLGCEGGMSYAEWEKASAEEREKAAKTRWCKVSYKGQEGYVAGWFLGEGSAPAQMAADEGPSFDCAKAESAAEELVCTTPVLAALDREMARLYRLAVDSPNLDADRAAELKAMQRGWIKGRDDCWKATDGLERCVAENYALRLEELRVGYANARSDDGAGITTGPYAYACEGLDALVSASFINADPPMAVLRWRDTVIVPVSEPSASGAKYGVESFDGRYEFFTKGTEALLTLPGQETMTCAQEEIG
ncbi:MliC family protein [Oceanomicrobium pacificus]|uniref:SH3 domain-containing protein n=1 Tax=Oceanomicrobium pacificus TaxID=2692916 RepID=A0A6B0TYE4_9RHOB|nr:MliC family protein [Oceanomicrobium pacificus]MXU63931.1 SH3 domain-containing protein [Oceanomicrobium pacificus]